MNQIFKSGYMRFDRYGRVEHHFDAENDFAFRFLPEEHRNHLFVAKIPIGNGMYDRIAWVAVSKDEKTILTGARQSEMPPRPTLKSVGKVQDWLVGWAKFVLDMTDGGTDGGTVSK